MDPSRKTNKCHHGHHEHIDVRKVPADSVPHGDAVSRNGRTVWAAYDSETLIAVGATANEARGKYREVRRQKERALHTPRVE
jgi:hypothetical protein